VEGVLEGVRYVFLGRVLESVGKVNVSKVLDSR